MSTMTIQTAQNDLIHRILEVQDMSVLDKIRKVLLRETVDKATNECISKSREEVLADWTAVCHNIQAAREGKLKGRPFEEVLNEL